MWKRDQMYLKTYHPTPPSVPSVHVEAAKAAAIGAVGGFVTGVGTCGGVPSCIVTRTITGAVATAEMSYAASALGKK